jgi:putative protein-disulfide isomerase
MCSSQRHPHGGDDALRSTGVATALDSPARLYDTIGRLLGVPARGPQPFSSASLEREGWTYDTELPAVAVTSMREIEPACTLPLLSRLQRAFYAEGVDITNPNTYPDLVEDLPVEPDAFVAELGTDDARERAWADFAAAQRLGVTGFPTLLLRLGDQMVVVTRGYRPFEEIEPPLTAWIAAREAESA